MFLSQAQNLAPVFAILAVVQAYGNNQSNNNNQNDQNSDYSSLKVNCTDDVNLILSIPYPEDTGHKIVAINAGSCNTTWQDIEDNGGSKYLGSTNAVNMSTVNLFFGDNEV